MKLRAEIRKMREEMERARDEWKTERDELQREKLAEATAAKQTASGLEDRLNAVQHQLKLAEARRRFVKKAREAKSPSITPSERLRRLRTSPNKTGLIRARKPAATDGAGLSRAGQKRRRDSTKAKLDRLIEEGAPLHRPDLPHPSESDIIAFNN